VKRINSWMEETRLDGKTALIRLFCKSCGASDLINILALSESFREPATDALRKAFAKLHRDCRHLRAV